jgi:hypothetical protein
LDNAGGADSALNVVKSSVLARNLTFRDVGGYALRANQANGFIATRIGVFGAGAGGAGC